MLIPFALHAQENKKEYLIKSAFIYNFVKFVEWPGDHATKNISEMNICVLGNNPFGDSLKGVMQKASNAELKLTVRNMGSDTSQLAACHIAFISQSVASQAGAVVDSLANSPVLTVSEIPAFARRGGMIEFTNVDQKIKLIVNAKAARGAGLRVDAQLLEIALEVITQ